MHGGGGPRGGGFGGGPRGGGFGGRGPGGPGGFGPRGFGPGGPGGFGPRGFGPGGPWGRPPRRPWGFGWRRGPYPVGCFGCMIPTVLGVLALAALLVWVIL